MEDNYITTVSGKSIRHSQFSEDDVDIKDIAHSLSMQCRWNGHTKFFYSVAQHSIAMSYQVEGRDRLLALLHDAAECYLADMPRPLKTDQYRELEQKLLQPILYKYTGTISLPESIKGYHGADNKMLVTEALQLMPEGTLGENYQDIEPYNIKLPMEYIGDVKLSFLKRFDFLYELYYKEIAVDRVAFSYYNLINRRLG